MLSPQFVPGVGFDPTSIFQLDGETRPEWIVLRMAAMIVFILVAMRVATRIVRWAGRRQIQDQVESVEEHNRQKRTKTVVNAWVSMIRYLAIVSIAIVVFIAWFPNKEAGFVGASIAIAVIGFASQSFLRDIIAGIAMLTERWFEVGDAITIEPWAMSGVVESINLRSTTLRGLNGERIRIHNMHLYGVRVARRGVVNMAMDIFVTDEVKGRALLQQVTDLLPRGATYVVEPFEIMESEQLGPELVRLHARGSVPPGREWLIETFAVSLLNEHDTDRIIKHGPVVFFADRIAEQRFAGSTAPLLADAAN